MKLLRPINLVSGLVTTLFSSSMSAFAGGHVSAHKNDHDAGHANEYIGIYKSGLSDAEKIQLATAVAPNNVSDNALVLDSDNSVLRDGDNGWVCMLGTPPVCKNPMCVDAPWQRWLDAYMNQKPYKNDANAIGVSLC